MEQQAPQARPGSNTNDVTIMIALFVVVTIGILVGFYYFLYKPKVEDINSMHAQRNSKENQLRGYITEVEDLWNYKDRKDILEKKWNVNKSYYVLGDPTQYTASERQFAIFDAYEAVFNLGDAGGVNVLYLKITEAFKFYMNDEPWDLPWNFLQFEWEIILSKRPGQDDGEGVSSQTATALVTPHTFTTVLRGGYEDVRRFIEVVQNMEGDYQRIFSIHCFEVTEEPSYASYPATFGRGGGVLADVTIQIEMLMSFYELNELGTVGTAPDVPGTVSCSFSGGGGGGSRGGGMSSGGGAGDSMSIG